MNTAIKLAKIIPLTERQIGTAKNISEMMRNFQVRRQGQGSCRNRSRTGSP
ncbi:MAG: hypothetical protein R2827_14715 [Bdellovibrionales bacterium]